MMPQDLDALEERMGYRFRDRKLLETALTHSSFIREQNREGEYNERLEFLGDAFFDAIVGEELYRLFPDREEGFLSKVRATIVCEPSLADQARRLKLGEIVRLSNGEEKTGGRERASILADALEAIIGAIYLDGGFPAAREFVLTMFREVIDDTTRGKYQIYDYKTVLQERLQAGGITDIRYEVLREEGPDHQKTFTVGLLIGGSLVSEGVGMSKKQAEQKAAENKLKEEGTNVL